ncbi:hypothetical protein PMAYCL1PPCAC_11007 [Pristionchus mayeri]|uniref:Uncharacterized protein n=1 Tax=Pristionchus mayeri TaxID=1317129 RepID=A0AAN4ZM78_9BILA|nr:hypothetical protein PMAYCL1PPCAC_11007 [Pristionchus mayeri]
MVEYHITTEQSKELLNTNPMLTPNWMADWCRERLGIQEPSDRSRVEPKQSPDCTVATPQQSEKTCQSTPKKIAKFLLGAFIFYSMTNTLKAHYFTVMRWLNTTCECSQSRIDYALIIFCIFAVAIYLNYRNAYIRQTESAATAYSDMFFPNADDRNGLISLLSGLWLLLQFALFVHVMRCSVTTLTYGQETASNLLKESRDISNDTEWYQDAKIAKEFSRKCFDGPFLTIIVMAASWIFYKSDEMKKWRTGKILWLVSRVIGSRWEMSFFNVAYFGILGESLTIFPVLEGWITKECLESLIYVSAFSFVTIPSYGIFLSLCIATELLVSWLHRGRNEAANDNLPKLDASGDALLDV